MRKDYFYWIMLLSMFGCNTTKNIVGNYLSNSKMLTKHTLSIKENGTFGYYLKGELLEVSSKGTWRLLDQKELILKSDQSLHSGVIDIVEEINSLAEGVSIKLIDENGQPLSFASVNVIGNNANGFNVDENGCGSYETTDLKSLSINYLGNQYEFALTKPKANNLILTLRLQSDEIMFFNNEVLMVQRRKLVGKNNLILHRK